VSALKICPQCGSEYELDQRFCPKDGSTLKLQDGTGEIVGSIIADRYHVLRKLGEGGMGTVYLAEHVKMGRKSAVKVMNPALVHDADAISRFNREASNASKINHPHVAAVYDFGETPEGVIYLAMEYIEGPALTKVIEDQGALPPLRAAEIARQVADALTVAHDMGIVHRDLKPDNIMLTKNRDGTDFAKVVDFGIAKIANNEAQRVTKTGLVIGTPDYMSPEQLAGDKLDGRSDTYSLGIVAFNMLTGKLPFPGDTLQESMIMRLTERPKQLMEMKEDVAWPQQVQAVLDRALERTAEDRYKTAAEFGRELYTAIKGMRDPSATKVVTVLNAPATRASSQQQPVPPTRVSSQSPPRGSPALPPRRPHRAALFGTIVMLLLGGAIYAAWVTMDRGVDTSAAAQIADTVPVTPQITEPIAPSIELPRQLGGINSMASGPESTPETARNALARLAALDSVARLAPDSTFRHFRFLRGKALITSGAVKAGCDSIKNLEGQLRQDERFKNAVVPIITACPSP
jgi:serine/threonine-protein kinase